MPCFIVDGVRGVAQAGANAHSVLMSVSYPCSLPSRWSYVPILSELDVACSRCGLCLQKLEIDTFSGYKIYPSKGKLFVRGDGKARTFAPPGLVSRPFALLVYRGVDAFTRARLLSPLRHAHLRVAPRLVLANPYPHA